VPESVASLEELLVEKLMHRLVTVTFVKRQLVANGAVRLRGPCHCDQVSQDCKVAFAACRARGCLRADAAHAESCMAPNSRLSLVGIRSPQDAAR
jgi:hypothetical protein